MQSRKKLSDNAQFEVVYLSARRCCMCFAINADFGEKAGQIAHLDQDRTNDSPSNLAWLCLPHHDAYDGKTSQSKGYSESEVRKYREQLQAEVARWRANQSRGERDDLHRFKQQLIEENLGLFLSAALATQAPAVRSIVLDQLRDADFKEQLINAWAFLDRPHDPEEPGLSRQDAMAMYIGTTDEGKEDLTVLLGLSGSAISAMSERDRNDSLFALHSDTIRSGLLLLNKIRTDRSSDSRHGG